MDNIKFGSDKHFAITHLQQPISELRYRNEKQWKDIEFGSDECFTQLHLPQPPSYFYIYDWELVNPLPDKQSN